MARKTKKNIDETISVDKRENGYYSTPKFVSKYISQRLIEYNKNGKKVLDPCVGREEMVTHFLENSFEVTGMDLFKYKEEYRSDFIQKDFIEFYAEAKNKSSQQYDFYIMNPPYNCHEVDYIKKNKKELNNLFEDVGTHNMYSMFISAVIDIAKEGALIGVITLDSFLTAGFHRNLRKKIIEECDILEIILAPTTLFSEQKADVRTAIIILRKGKSDKKRVILKNRTTSNEEFERVLINRDFTYYNIDDFILKSEKDNMEFVIETPLEIRNLFNNKRLGDIYRCVTGISTGNDALYLRNNKIEGFTVPFYKNPANDQFYTEKILYLTDSFLEISKTNRTFNVRNKDLLFKGGISCSSMGVKFSAVLLPENSAYGVNPNIIVDESEKWWLLAYLNSKLVAYLVRGVLNRSNMVTSGYIARVPLIEISDEEKAILGELAAEAYKKIKNREEISGIMKTINERVFECAKLSEESRKFIVEFEEKIKKNT